MRAAAEAVRQARQAYLDSLDAEERAAFLASLEPTPPKKRAAARAALLKERPGLGRWIVTCGLCHRQGYKPTMPAEIDRRGTAALARRLFPPLALQNYLCGRCHQKTEKKRRELEAKMQQIIANLPPNVKVKVVQPRKRGQP